MRKKKSKRYENGFQDEYDNKTIRLFTKFKSKSDNQSNYVRNISENDVTFCYGPAGTGKTACAVALACQYLAEGRIDSIVLTRPIVQTGKGIGFLPGNLEDKINPFLVPLLEELDVHLGSHVVKKLIEDEVIKLCPLELMRGRNFHGSFMILDEAQNADRDQIKMFLTRIGRDTKCVITGDINQTDIRRCDLSDIIERLSGIRGIGVTELTTEDIVRNGIIGRILNALER
jgi:phosphate starvation-inducible PhoH-like protein